MWLHAFRGLQAAAVCHPPAGSGANLPGGSTIPLGSISAAHEELPFELRALEIGLDTVGWPLAAGGAAQAGKPASMLDGVLPRVALLAGRRQSSCTQRGSSARTAGTL